MLTTAARTLASPLRKVRVGGLACSATTSPSTASPRNSRRSLDGRHPAPRTRNGARGPGATAGDRRSRSRAAGRAAPPHRRGRHGAVVRPLRIWRRRSRPRRGRSGGPRGPRPRCEADRTLPELLLERLDQLDQGQGVGIEILGEGRGLRDVDGSISRMSASRSRTSSNTRCRSNGLRSTWVSAGTASPAARDYRK